MKKSLKRFIGMLAVVALCLGILNINAIDVQAATSITGNNTRSTSILPDTHFSTIPPADA